jgi:hypothetical protein
MMVLALGYALNNHLTVYLVVAADLRTIHMVQSSSSIVSALILWRFADRKIVRVQWFAVIFQTIWSILSQVRSLLLKQFSIKNRPRSLILRHYTC